MKFVAVFLFVLITEPYIFAEDYGVVIGSSLSAGIITKGDKNYSKYKDIAFIEDSTGLRWDNFYATGTESAYKWARLAVLTDQVLNHGKKGPEVCPIGIQALFLDAKQG